MIWWVAFLFFAGMMLILAEFIIPGGVCGMVGGLMVLGSCALGVYQYPDLAWLIVVGEIVGAPFSYCYRRESGRECGREVCPRSMRQGERSNVEADCLSDCSCHARAAPALGAL